MDSWILSLLIFLPVAGAIGMLIASVSIGKENKIEIVYTIKPLSGEEDVLKTILSDTCVKKSAVTDILDSHLLLKCKDLNN